MSKWFVVMLSLVFLAGCAGGSKPSKAPAKPKVGSGDKAKQTESKTKEEADTKPSTRREGS